MSESNDYSPRILIADDEPYLRAELRESLAELWPQARVVAEASDGIEALRLGRETQPDVAFLDIRMPGLTGIELAHAFSQRTHIVFVTAYGEHAVDAFDEGAVDYVMKPASGERLARAVERVRARIAAATQPPAAEITAPLTCLQASVGQAIHFIDLADVVYFCADAKYTRVVTEKMEAHIRLSLKELADTLDPRAFWQVHRGYMVAVKRIASAVRAEDGALWLHLRGHAARVPVSTRFQHLFKAM
jgi:DNA-binding LytR/AlgR family response regulator